MSATVARRVMLWWATAAARGRRQRFLAADAEHAPRRRSDDAVDGEPVASLQAAYGGLGFRAEVAVGR